MNSDQIREAFLRFFEEKQHRIIPSSSLIPHGDPTLLLTTAGMVQIKPYFLGMAVPPGPRLASCQKCFRTTDISSVGDAKHLTFFEMLGNFSVGDYFKKEAIAWAWEFVTERLKLSPELLWVTIYLDDDEAFNYWRAIGFPENRIVRLGEDDNFWGPAGDSGPCGPCSEIHYDFGEEAGCGKPDCGPGCDCSRFSEIWNLVFTQYNQASGGKRTPLPKPNIDTGMGLERVAAVMQGVSSVYDTDLFVYLRDKICDLTGIKHGKDKIADQSVRIIAEHSRGITFLIADGVLPSNEGRGYVLRRVLRRVCFFGRKLGVEDPFLNEIAQTVIARMGHVYPELVKNQSLIQEVVKLEEEKFTSTLDAGINLVDKAVDEALKQGKNSITGEEAFRFWDTYGFPLELTTEIAREKGLDIDLEGFEVEMEKQRERARAGHKFSGDKSSGKDKATVIYKPDRTNFVGYDKLKTSSKVSYILDQESGQSVESAKKGQKVAVVLEATPFYGEMGGQVGDTGRITADSSQIDITDTVWSPYGNLAEGAIVHLGQVVKGKISVGDIAEAEVEGDYRLDIARNHTATHLLQAALRQVLGSHVQQRGSMVHPEGFRFDFAHLTAINKQQLDDIQHFVNERIRENLPVKSKVVPYKQAIADGAIALFEEKYGDTVRVLEIGGPLISSELCGGTHVKSTGEIGLFIITGESSIGTGLRRIEAITGRKAEEFLRECLSTVATVAEELKSSPPEIADKVKALAAELATERKRSASLERELARYTVNSLIDKAEQVDGITVLSAKVLSASLPVLREMGDLLRDRLKSAVIVLGTVQDGKPGFVAMVTPDLVKRGLHAGDIVKQVAAVTGGGGGGKANMAQAGGNDKSKLDEALALVKQIVQKVSR
ncbi:MAG: alanine--tRNA ligase [Chloroflexi bacterium RBG_19FT_COMBO_48_23]|nr:MAG: alanine--tRNA ligase [Chloroflexi bacterium RBG_19FT_COMBO_48_23]